MSSTSLPACNPYLQVRGAGRTPRWRGITLVHEMKVRRISVSSASDNSRSAPATPPRSPLVEPFAGGGSFP